jgi:uncharacterized RDD family membrane protein YckC
VFCSKCGATLSAGSAFCTTCGNPIGPTTASAALPPAYPPSALPPLAAYGGVAGMTTARSFVYAGFWLRFVAYLIDSIILGLVLVALLIPFALMTGVASQLQFAARHPNVQNPAGAAAVGLTILVMIVLAIVLPWLYHAYLESGPKQATWGKQAIGLYVTDLSGNPVTFARASGRFFAKIITGLIPLAIGYIMAAFTERRQALHDMIAGCLVLRR